LARQPDGKLLAGGYFQYHDGQPRSEIERLNLDGSHDATFSSPLYAYALVRAIAVQPDGKLVVGGEFTSSEYANAVPGPARLVRLNADGSRDNTFPIGAGMGPGTQSTAYVNTLAIQPDGKIIVGGHFETVDMETQYHQLVRLFGSGINGVGELNGANTLLLLQDASTGLLALKAPPTHTGEALLQLHGVNGQVIHNDRVRLSGVPIPLPQDLRPGPYVASLTQGTQRLSVKVVVP
jgi:uncharacterized delta-60 repeat protein